MTRARSALRALAVCALVALCVTLTTTAPAAAASARVLVATRASGAGTEIAAGLATELVKGAAGEVGAQLMGGVVASLGVGGDAATSAKLAEIRKSLARIGEQTTSLQAQTSALAQAIANGDYSNALSRAQPLRGKIDYAEDLLRKAAAQTVPEEALQVLSPGSWLAGADTETVSFPKVIARDRVTSSDGNGHSGQSAVFAVVPNGV
jgi:hypothetical protein